MRMRACVNVSEKERKPKSARAQGDKSTHTDAHTYKKEKKKPHTQKKQQTNKTTSHLSIDKVDLDWVVSVDVLVGEEEFLSQHECFVGLHALRSEGQLVLQPLLVLLFREARSRGKAAQEKGREGERGRERERETGKKTHQIKGSSVTSGCHHVGPRSLHLQWKSTHRHLLSQLGERFLARFARLFWGRRPVVQHKRKLLVVLNADPMAHVPDNCSNRLALVNLTPGAM